MNTFSEDKKELSKKIIELCKEFESKHDVQIDKLDYKKDYFEGFAPAQIESDIFSRCWITVS